MQERRPISEEGWKEGQRRLSDHSVVERIAICKTMLRDCEQESRANACAIFTWGIIGYGGSAYLNLTNTGPEAIQTASVIWAGYVTVGAYLNTKDIKQKRKD